MKVKFNKDYTNGRGRKFKKGVEEGLTKDIARPLIKKGICTEVKEWVDTGIVDKDNNQILKEK